MPSLYQGIGIPFNVVDVQIRLLLVLYHLNCVRSYNPTEDSWSVNWTSDFLCLRKWSTFVLNSQVLSPSLDTVAGPFPLSYHSYFLFRSGRYVFLLTLTLEPLELVSLFTLNPMYLKTVDIVSRNRKRIQSPFGTLVTDRTSYNRKLY